MNAQQNYYDPKNPQGPNYNPTNSPQYNTTTSPDSADIVEDTVKKEKKPFNWKNNPTVATIASAIIPGAGQFYNKKYWKIPIIWILLGGTGYFFYQSDLQYNNYRLAYINFVDYRLEPESRRDGYNRTKIAESSLNYFGSGGSSMREFNSRFTADSLNNANSIAFYRDNVRRTRDWSALFFAFAYILNIADAAVDAHFANFDVSDKLSMEIEPTFLSYSGLPQMGGTLRLTFHVKRKKYIHSF